MLLRSLASATACSTVHPSHVTRSSGHSLVQAALTSDTSTTASCVPNAVLIFDGRTAYVGALQPIGKDEEDSEEDAVLEGYRCKNQACDGFLLPDSGKKAYTCQKCSISRDEEEVKRMIGEILMLSDKASSFLSSGNNTEAGTIYKIIEQLERKLYHAFSITLLHTRETLLKIYMELQDWQTALEYCRLTIPVYERVYPPFHPMTGLQFYTCGKLEWLLERTEDALKSFTMAADILGITHGTKSQFMKELFGKLEEARAEVSFRLSSRDGHDEPFS